MIYAFLTVFAVLTVIFAVVARKKISECENEAERRAVKAKWQLICGLLGAACIVCAGIMIFTMFK